jgi:hypothetical protein
MLDNNNTTYLRFRIFHFMWLVFILLHLFVTVTGWTTIGNDFLNPSSHFFIIANFLAVVFAIISLVRPNRILYFALSILFLTAAKVDVMPAIPNHIVLMLIIHLTLLISLLLYWDRSLDIKERISQWFGKVAPYLRIELLIVYFFVVFHKLNYDFFNPEVSCAVELYTDIAGIYPLMPQGEWINRAMIIFTLLLELLIPILLIIPATRVIGVMMGVVFHLMLALHPNLMILSFTAELYALFVLFLPKEVIGRMYLLMQKIQQIRLRDIQIRLVVGCALMIGGSLAAIIWFMGGFTFQVIDEILFFVLMALWTLWSLLLIGAIFLLSRGRVLNLAGSSSPFFNISWSPLLIFLLLTVFNGLTPYIGLKTATNFSMFSNLNVVGEENNHFFMPSDVKFSGFQTDTVTVQATNDSHLNEFIKQEYQITWFELKKYLYENQKRDFYAQFSRNGDEIFIYQPEQMAGGWEELNWLTRKLLIFRHIPKSGHTSCQW